MKDSWEKKEEANYDVCITNFPMYASTVIFELYEEI